LKMFEKDLEFRRQAGATVQMGIARWSIARTYRAQGRVEEALKIQMELLNDPDRKGNDSEGYTREEIGECLLLLGRKSEASPYFARAWELLHNDRWLQRDEPQRLQRLKELGNMR